MSESFHACDIAIIGAGPAGLAAATSAAAQGKSVLVFDESPWLGGQIWRGVESKGKPSSAHAAILRARSSGARFLHETTVIDFPAPNLLRAEGPGGPSCVSWGKLILATGARELFLPFPGWTLPGVFGVGGLQALAKAGWPVQDKRVVIAGTGPLLLAVADGLRALGAQVVCIAEQAPWKRVRAFGATLLSEPSKLAQALGLMARLRGVPHRCGWWPARAEGQESVARVVLTNGNDTVTHECDYLACAFGLVPNIELATLLGCRIENGFVAVDRSQQTSMPDVYCAGEPTGIGGYECAAVEGEIAGLVAAGATHRAERLCGRRGRAHAFRERLRNAFAIEAPITKLAERDTIVCRCEDVPHGTLRHYSDWREAKLHTRCGMGPCQGRVCGAAAQVLYGWSLESVRPPVAPARIGSLVCLPPLVENPS